MQRRRGFEIEPQMQDNMLEFENIPNVFEIRRYQR